MNVIILPVSPSFPKLCSSPACQTESNALVKSRKTAMVGLSRIRPSLVSDSRRASASNVECLVLKPLWLGSMSDFCSR